jgi:hypothetical protein
MAMCVPFIKKKCDHNPPPPPPLPSFRYESTGHGRNTEEEKQGEELKVASLSDDHGRKISQSWAWSILRDDRARETATAGNLNETCRNEVIVTTSYST